MRMSRLSKCVAPVVLTLGLGVIPPSAFQQQAAAAPSGVVAKAALSRKLPEVRFESTSLGDAIDYLRDVTGANIAVNWKALAESNVTRESTINLRLYNVSLAKALSLVLSEAGSGSALAFNIDENVIEVTTQQLADQKMIVRVYPIEDLIMEIPNFTDAPDFNLQSQSSGGGGSGSGGGGSGGGGLLGGGSGSKSNNEEKTKTRDERGQEIIDLIINTIRPEIWTQNGGTASIRFFNGSLIVSAPQSVHEMIGG